MIVPKALIKTLRGMNHFSGLNPNDPEEWLPFEALMDQMIYPLIKDIHQNLPTGLDYSSFNVSAYYEFLHLMARVSTKHRFDKHFLYKIFTGLQVILTDNPPSTTRELVNLLWSLASFSPYEPCNASDYEIQDQINAVLISLKDCLLPQILDHADELSEKDFADFLWSLATLGYECSLEFQRKTLPVLFFKQVSDLNEARLSDAILSMAKLGVKWEDLRSATREKTYVAIQEKIDKGIKPGHFSILLWGLACMEASWENLAPLQALLAHTAKQCASQFSQLSINQLTQLQALGFPLEGEWGEAVVQSTQSEFEKDVLRHLSRFFSKESAEIVCRTDKKLLGIYQPDISVLSQDGEPLVHIECDGAGHYFRAGSRTLLPSTLMRNRAYQGNQIPFIAIAYWNKNKTNLIERQVARYLPKKALPHTVYEPPVEKAGRRPRSKSMVSVMPETICSRLYTLREKTGLADYDLEDMVAQFKHVLQFFRTESTEAAQRRVQEDGARSSSYLIDVARNLSDKLNSASHSELFDTIFVCFESEFCVLQMTEKNTKRMLIHFLLACGELGVAYEKIPPAWIEHLKGTRMSEDEMLNLFNAFTVFGCSWDRFDLELKRFLLRSLEKTHVFLNLENFESLVSALIQLKVRSVDLPPEFLDALLKMKAESKLEPDSPLLQYVIESPAAPVEAVTPMRSETVKAEKKQEAFVKPSKPSTEHRYMQLHPSLPRPRIVHHMAVPGRPDHPIILAQTTHTSISASRNGQQLRPRMVQEHDHQTMMYYGPCYMAVLPPPLLVYYPAFYVGACQPTHRPIGGSENQPPTDQVYRASGYSKPKAKF